MAKATPNITDDLVDAAQQLLAARQDGMVTTEEWFALAKAVAAHTGVDPADLLTERDLDQNP